MTPGPGYAYALMSTTSPLIDRVNLDLIVRVEETGTISGAARLLSISPSLATRKIAAIERDLGIKLFHRTTRSTQITEAGRIAVDWAHKMLESESQMRDQLNRIDKEPSGRVRFACPEFLISRLLAGWLVDFMERHPQIHLSLLAADRPVQLAEERYDVGVHIGGTPDANLVGRRLYEFQMGLFASRPYLERHGVPQRPEDLLDHKLIRHATLEDEQWHLRADDGTRTDIPLDRAIETSNAVLATELLDRGAGIVKLARRTVKLGLFSNEIVEVLPDHEAMLPDGERYCLWLLFPDRKVLSRTRLFADSLSAHLMGLDHPQA